MYSYRGRHTCKSTFMSEFIWTWVHMFTIGKLISIFYCYQLSSNSNISDLYLGKNYKVDNNNNS